MRARHPSTGTAPVEWWFHQMSSLRSAREHRPVLGETAFDISRNERHRAGERSERVSRREGRYREYRFAVPALSPHINWPGVDPTVLSLTEAAWGWGASGHLQEWV